MMAKIASGQPLETATAMSLASPDTARSNLLEVLLRLALAGDVRAAKLYLDYSLREAVKAQTGFTLEEALKLIQDGASDKESDNDAA
jgi:hypothetical protein